MTPDLCHREPEFFRVMRRCREQLVRLAGGGPGWSAVLLTGSGTAAVEAAIVSLVPRDRSVLIVNNGTYGERMLRIVRAHGIAAVVLTCDTTIPVAADDVAAALAAHPEISHVAVVHHETTTGLLNPVAEVTRVAARYGRRVIVDAMSSLYGEPFDLEQQGLDAVAASANKCLQGVAGMAFVLARRSALDEMQGRSARSVYLDLYQQYMAQEQDNTPFTPAIQVLYAMAQALHELEVETVPVRVARYAANARVLREGMLRLGFEILVPEGARSNILTTFKLLSGMDYDTLHEAMKRRGYIIYAGQGDLRKYAFRVANMGTLAPKDMEGVVAAFAACLDEVGPQPAVRSA
jgi:2-aminoethylphosphonate-pyruvate transaminase